MKGNERWRSRVSWSEGVRKGEVGEVRGRKVGEIIRGEGRGGGSGVNEGRRSMK